MEKISVGLIKKLRESTGVPIARVKRVLQDVGGDEKKAYALLRKEGFEKAEKVGKRTTNQGVIATYLHHSQKVASMIEVMCETDFVAKNEIFQDLAHNLAMQVASMNPKDADELFNQEFIRDPKKKISDLIKETIAKTGENIRVGRIFRVELGQPTKN